MLICLIGRAQSGKSTCAKRLMTDHAYVRVSFADPLKHMLIKAGMCTVDECYENKTEMSRWLLQKIGTDIFRKQIDPNFWVQKTEEMILNDIDTDDIVIDDARFPNEVKMVLGLGGCIIKIVRTDYIDPITDSQHESEAYVDKLPFHFKLECPSGVDNLQKEFDKILEHISKLGVTDLDKILQVPNGTDMSDLFDHRKR